MVFRSAREADGRGSALHLGPSRRSWRSAFVAIGRLARHPSAALAIARARLAGRRLRARQMLAALVGIDHRLALPARVLDRYLAHSTGTRMPVPPPSAGEGTPRGGGGEGQRDVAGFGPHPASSGPPLTQGPAFPVEGGGRSAARDRFSGDLVILGEGMLAAGAAAHIEAAFAESPDLHALYGDALVQDLPAAPVLPVLPPAFDPDLLAAVDYLGVLAIRRSALDTLPACPTDAAFRIVERHGPAAIGHLPEILSVRTAASPKRDASAGEGAGRLDALRAHLDRTGRAGARIDTDGHGLTRVLHPLPAVPPLASIIVPTRDRLDLLRPCLDSLTHCTDWPALEILVCDNDSREPETLAYLAALEGEGRGGVVPCPGPFNFAAMNNAAAARARGRLLVFVNNDVEAFRPDWLGLMAREALRPEVGAVGAKLLDGAGRIQHGGIVLGTGGGLVTHAHRHFPGDAPGYLSGLRATHAVSAVTAACLVVEAVKFARVGGFDEAAFAVDFNDVDLCLRLAAAGHRTLLVSGAVLHHREAASRRWTPQARGRHQAEIARLKKRWGPLLAQDPHYHPGFDPDLSTHARLRAGFPGANLSSDPRPVRRPAY